ncbi:MAG: hypothetical protein QOE63_957, partial [Acidimicrobiaceae bacterium]
GKAEVVAASAMYDVRAYGLGGLEPAGWPKQTSGWSVATPGLGDIDGDGTLEVVVPDRDGRLFVWHTAGSACQQVEWPQRGHDPTNSSNYQVDGQRPGVIGNLRVTTVADGQVVVQFDGTGDDGACGEAAGYRLTVGGVASDVAGGSGPHEVTLARPAAAALVAVQAVDDAGNLGYAATVELSAVSTAAARPVSPAVVAPVTRLPATGGEVDSTAVALLTIALLVRVVARQRGAKSEPGA